MSQSVQLIEFPGRAVVPYDAGGRPAAIGAATLLDDITAAFRRHLSLPDCAPEAIALWVLFAHAFDAWRASPRLFFSSPTPQCGKSTALSMIGALTPRSRPASNMTTAVVFRLIEQERPTLLIDEADTFLHAKGDLRGILNSGHTPAGAFVWRCDGPEHQPRSYSTWCPMVIAGIGTVWPALQTRSIEIRMRRRRADEPIEPLTPGVLADLEWLNQQAAQWALENIGVLQAAAPEVPEGLINRSRDNWLPLLAVADHAGGDWPERARSAAILLSGGAEEQTRGVQFLTAIRKVFAGWEGHRIGSEDLCRALHDLEDETWADSVGRQALTTRRLAAELKPFGINPKVFREGSRTPRGYERDQFLDAFARYLPPAF